MKSSLVICVLAALLGIGSCLECEVCEGPGTSCSGTVQTCAAGYDSCGIIVTETTIAGMKQQVTVKSCMKSGSCKAGPLTMNFGNGVTMKQGIGCCVGDACRTTTVTVPLADTKPNGRSCPACVALLFAQCNEEAIYCTGAATRCIEVAATVTTGGIATSMTMKGCTTEAVCAHITDASGSFAGTGMNLTLKCKAPVTARGPVGLLIPALAGLLLMQFLS